MTESKPKQWKAVPTNRGIEILEEGYGYVMTVTPQNHGVCHIEEYSELIARAPELLAENERLRAYIDAYKRDCKRLEDRLNVENQANQALREDATKWREAYQNADRTYSEVCEQLRVELAAMTCDRDAFEARYEQSQRELKTATVLGAKATHELAELREAARECRRVLDELMSCDGWTESLKDRDPGSVVNWVGPRVYKVDDVLRAALADTDPGKGGE